MTRSRLFLSSILALIASNCSFAQHLSVSVLGGARLTGALDPDAQNRDESRFYTVGPTIEISLPSKLSLEVDALYRRMGDSGGTCVFTFCAFTRTRANSWEFPIILKRRLAIRGAAPFAGLGYSPRRVGQRTEQTVSYRTGSVAGESVDYTSSHTTSKSPAEVSHGLVAAGGIELSAQKFKVGPEIRYTRWKDRFWEYNGSHGFFTGSNLNQFEILLRIRR